MMPSCLGGRALLTVLMLTAQVSLVVPGTSPEKVCENGCKNGGWCAIFSDRAECQCLVEYTGPECEERKASNPLAARSIEEKKSIEDATTFPNIGYALQGYNIFEGNPLAMTHDPGFTLIPIFDADYTENKLSADMQHRIPKGFVVENLDTCSVSFSSKEIRSSEELEQHLAVSANFEVSAYGGEFSASAEYRQTTQSMKTEDALYVMSSAMCTNYYAKLVEWNLPPTNADFDAAVVRLNGDHTFVTAFLETYGTHFLNEVIFGARFTKEHKVSKTSAEELSNSQFSLAMQASYSGAVSVGGGASLSTEQMEAAMTFQSNVETTTVTMGQRPPADGDVNTWAASVSESPLPVKYVLSPIEVLFTTEVIGNLSVNVDDLRSVIQNELTAWKQKYISEYDAWMIQQEQQFSDTLWAERKLESGASLVSNDGHCEAKMQSDGNFVIYRRGNLQWETNTYNAYINGAGYLELQGDGNLVLYHGIGQIMWQTDTDGKSPKKLVMQDGCHLVLYDQDDNIIWKYWFDTLKPGQELNKGEYLTSENGNFRAWMQMDGNFVIYRKINVNDDSWEEGNRVAMASSETLNSGFRIAHQTDGNMVLYSTDNTALWYSNTYGDETTRLTLQFDGNFVLIRSDGTVAWATNVFYP